MAEMKESSATAKGNDDPNKYLTARVINVRFEGTYKACRERMPIARDWHWPADPDGYKQSKKAVVLPIKNSTPTRTATVKVTVGGKGMSGQGKIIGTLGKLVFEGTIPLSVNTHEVSVTLKEIPDGLTWVKGLMIWEIEAGTHAALAGTTLVELFFVFDEPAKQKFFNTDGVWIEALRFIFKEARLDGTKKIKDAVGKVTKCCFNRHLYDIDEGAEHFGGKTNKFSLANYMKPVHGIVNCYDQTYAVIVFSGALGVTVGGLFQLHFGYLKKTQLVGRGTCNNPFPMDKYEAAEREWKLSGNKARMPSIQDFLVVDPQDIYRSAFINHMFCRYADESAYDACAGPATGELSYKNYLNESIDLVTPEPAQNHRFPKKRQDIEFNFTKKLFDIDMPGFNAGVHAVE